MSCPARGRHVRHGLVPGEGASPCRHPSIQDPPPSCSAEHAIIPERMLRLENTPAIRPVTSSSTTRPHTGVRVHRPRIEVELRSRAMCLMFLGFSRMFHLYSRLD